MRSLLGLCNMRNEIIKKVGVTNGAALVVTVVLCYVYDFLYRKYMPYRQIGFPPANYLFQFIIPILIFTTNWKTLKIVNKVIRFLVSLVCTIIITAVFWELTIILNIDKPFRINNLMAI